MRCQFIKVTQAKQTKTLFMTYGTNNSNALTFLALFYFLALLLLYVFGLGHTGLYDNAEAQIAQTSLASNSLVDAFLFSVQDIGADKTILLPLQGVQYLSATLFGETVFALRLPSALAAFLMVFVFYNSVWLLTRSKRYALMAAATFGLCPGVLVAARLATPDALFVLFALSATFMLMGNIYQNERSHLRLFVVGLLMGLAFLIGGVWAFILPFLVAFLLAILKEHRGYNLASIAPFSVFVASIIALFPWLLFVLKEKAPEGLLETLYYLSQVHHLQSAVPDFSWWFVPLALAVVTLPWCLFLMPWFFSNIIHVLGRIRHPEPREALPAFAFVWLLFSIGALIVMHYVLQINISSMFLVFALWLAAPMALIVADVFDRLPSAALGFSWFALAFVLAVMLAVSFVWLPQAATILSGADDYVNLYQLFERFGLSLQVKDPFWLEVLSVKPEWGTTSAVVGALLFVGLVVGAYLMRHGALEGPLFAFIGVWFALFIAVQGLAPAVYDHLQLPLKWMSVKIKKEQAQTPVQVTLYALDRPSVSYVSGVAYRQTNQAEQAFKTLSLPLFVLTDIKNMPQLEPHVPAGATHECFGGYCLVEVYR